MAGFIYKKLLLSCLAVLLLAGCAENSGEGGGGPASVSGVEAPDGQAGFQTADAKVPEGVAAAVWEEMGMALHDDRKLSGDTMYYVEFEWDGEKYTDGSLYRQRRGERDAEEVTDFGGGRLASYFVDGGENVYCLYSAGEDSEPEYFLRKITADGKTAYDCPASGGAGGSGGIRGAELRDGGGADRIYIGEADGQGRVCLADSQGSLYLFCADGGYACTGSAPWDRDSFHGGQCGLAAGGDGTVYAYRTEERDLTLWAVDMESGTLGAAQTLRIGDRADPAEISRPSASLEVHSGYGYGILIWDSDALWGYDTASGTLTRFLGWGDAGVSLKDYTVDAVGILEGGALYVLAYQSYQDGALVRIEFRDPAQVQEKKTVTLGRLNVDNMIGYELLDDMVSSFNRADKEYQVEFVEYDRKDYWTKFYLTFVQGQGTDLVLVTLGDFRVLTNMGILEDLTPWFAASETVSGEDLLPSVREAGTVGEELLCVFPYFEAEGFKVKKGTTQNSTWTAEEYLALGERYPDAAMEGFEPEYYKNDIIRNTFVMDMENYIDWEKAECSFDSGKFISLVERVAALKDPAVYDPADWTEGLHERFLDGRILTEKASIYSLDRLRMVDCEGYAELAGYPNDSGRARFKMQCWLPLGINSASEVKEGAWAFLEYVLSEEYQSKSKEHLRDSRGFPVRRDSLETYMERGTRSTKDLTEEEKELVRWIADNMYWYEKVHVDAFRAALVEETDAVWAGDKTAEEAARIIQNRMELYLKEQFE